MTSLDDRYVEGFAQHCKQAGIDPEQLLGTPDSKKKKLHRPRLKQVLSVLDDLPAIARTVAQASKEAEEHEASNLQLIGAAPTVHDTESDYERRRRLMNILFMAVTGGAIGASQASRHSPNPDTARRNTLMGGAAGAALGAGTGALTNAIRHYLGFSAMGNPVTQAKEAASVRRIQALM